jgi:hypothetical protein
MIKHVNFSLKNESNFKKRKTILAFKRIKPSILSLKKVNKIIFFKKK